MAVNSDNPIKRGADDSLQRHMGAQSVARDIREADTTEGYVVGIVGPWGSGKTSLVNMTREALQHDPVIPVIDFNPWLFSGTHELVEAFFRELSAQLRLRSSRLAAIAQAVDDYSELLSPAEVIPVVGSWLAGVRGAAKVISDLREKRKGSVTARRDKLAQQLTELEQPIVVVIDDIDRLESSEIRDIFKLVRLTASFPKVVYVLAFDRMRVEVALSQSGFDGRAYLEKIVQLGIDVPAVPDSLLLRQIGEILEAALNDLEVPEHFNQDAWPDILMEIIRPLLANMRDVKRYAAASRSKVRALGGQVEMVDVLALEAIRLFLPDVYQAIVQGRDGLTTTGGWQTRYEDPRLKQQVEHVVKVGEAHPDLVRALIKRIFPAGQRHIESNTFGGDLMKTWLRERRVAHPALLAAYLEQVANDDLQAFGLAEQAYAVLRDEAAFERVLLSYDLDKLEDVVAALEAFEGDYPREAVVPGSRVLLNLLPRLPERPRGMFSWGGGRLVVSRVVLRLLRPIESPDEALAAVRDILSGVSSLSSKLELINLVGHGEGVGHNLITEAEQVSLEQEWLRQLNETSPERLALEREPLRLLSSPKHFAGGEVAHVDPVSTALTSAVLLDARNVVRSQNMGNRAVKQSTYLQWTTLMELFGGEEQLQMAVDRLRGRQEEDLQAAIALVDRYLGGWRPERWSND